ncbi:MAG: ChaN family lipoprotein, partial [Bdellovibrionales bacterium]|nr:ChaN family lipoprotein [Bdellovibrionales bacterium]
MQEKQEWIRSRKKLLKQIKGQVLAIQGRDEQIDAYANAYKLEFRSQWQAYNAQDLVRDLSQYQFVLGGDFHAFTQAQRTHLRILRDWPDKKSVVLALECIEAKYQKALELYLIDELSEQDFL